MNEKQFNCVLGKDYHIINDNFDNMTYFLQERNDVVKLVGVLNEQQATIDTYKEAVLTLVGILAENGIIVSGVKDECEKN